MERTEQVAGALGTRCSSWLPCPPRTPVPTAEPRVTAYAVFPTCCLFLSLFLLSEPAVGLLRLGKPQGLRNKLKGKNSHSLPVTRLAELQSLRHNGTWGWQARDEPTSVRLI